MSAAAERDAERQHVLDGRYELCRELGRGSTGVVWEARDLLADEPVAVKIVHADLLSRPLARKRFLREVESASALQHPNSVQVKAHGQTAEGVGYLVMERLVGTTLAARLREEGALPQELAIQIATQVLDAVGAAHRLRIVHRDLKPSNVILIERDGHPNFAKVCDFGLAKAIAPETSELDRARHPELASLCTHEGEICGTPEYMAPEQALGESVDARADLYAVAVLLFHSVVGQLPFTGRSAFAIVSQHLTAIPPRPSALRPDLTIFPALENLILRGLAKDRSERPSSAEVFRADLLQIERDIGRRRQRSAALGAAPAGPPGDTLPPVAATGQRRRMSRPFLALGFAPIVLGLLAWWQARRIDTPIALRGESHALAPAPPRAAVAAYPPEPHEAIAPRSQPAALSSTNAASGSGDAVASQGAPPLAVAARAPAAVEKRPSEPAAGEPAMRIARPAPSAAEADASPLAQAAALLSQGHVQEACDAGQRAAAAAPGSAAAQRFLGQCLMRLGRAEEARAHYRDYLRIAPSARDAPYVEAIVGSEPP